MNEPKQKEPRSPHRTQWAAQFAVASELCKRGYEVALTMGNNTPVADLMVVGPKTRRMFLVDVKGLYRRNPWVIKRKEARTDLFYILAYVPDDEPNQFFVLTQAQVHGYIDHELQRLGRAADYKMTGVLWVQAAEHRDWEVLPG